MFADFEARDVEQCGATIDQSVAAGDDNASVWWWCMRPIGHDGHHAALEAADDKHPAYYLEWPLE